MQFGDSVVYIENGEEYNATVLGSRELDDHMGKDNEPLLTLAFFKQVMAPGPDGKPVIKSVVGTQAQSDLVQFRHDVAHDSHEFNEESKKKYHAIHGGVSIPYEEEVEVPASKGRPASSYTAKKIKHVVNYPGGRWRESVISTFTGSQVLGEGDNS